jgi:pimeloyl-ACP methyl ester carboxylesterase
LHEIINFHAQDCRPGLLGTSWGAMLALAYAAAHPSSVGTLILVGCGTFDLAARAELQRVVAERMTEAIRARLKAAEQLDPDKCLKVSAEAMMPIYSYDPLISPHEEDEVDARAHQETWDDMLLLQSEGFYPAAFAAIKVPVLMVHGAFDPLPGGLIAKGLHLHLPQLDYHELERCGHYPWLEKAAADAFYSLVRSWLDCHLKAPDASATLRITASDNPE